MSTDPTIESTDHVGNFPGSGCTTVTFSPSKTDHDGDLAGGITVELSLDEQTIEKKKHADSPCDEVIECFIDEDSVSPPKKCRFTLLLLMGVLAVAVIATAVVVPLFVVPLFKKEQQESRSLCVPYEVEDIKETKLTVTIDDLNRTITDSEIKEIEGAVVKAYNDVSGICDDVYARWMYQSLIGDQELNNEDNITSLILDIHTFVSCNGCPDEESFASIFTDAAAGVLETRRLIKARQRGLEKSTINALDVFQAIEKEVKAGIDGAGDISKVEMTSQSTPDEVLTIQLHPLDSQDSKSSETPQSTETPQSPGSSEELSWVLELFESSCPISESTVSGTPLNSLCDCPEKSSNSSRYRRTLDASPEPTLPPVVKSNPIDFAQAVHDPSSVAFLGLEDLFTRFQDKFSLLELVPGTPKFIRTDGNGDVCFNRILGIDAIQFNFYLLENGIQYPPFTPDPIDPLASAAIKMFMDNYQSLFRLCQGQEYLIRPLDLVDPLATFPDADINIFMRNVKITCIGCIIKSSKFEEILDKDIHHWSAVRIPEIPFALLGSMAPPFVASGLVVEGLTFQDFESVTCDNGASFMFAFSGVSRDVEFKDCTFQDMVLEDGFFRGGYLNSTYTDPYIGPGELANDLTFDGCTFENVTTQASFFVYSTCECETATVEREGPVFNLTLRNNTFIDIAAGVGSSVDDSSFFRFLTDTGDSSLYQLQLEGRNCFENVTVPQSEIAVDNFDLLFTPTDYVPPGIIEPIGTGSITFSYDCNLV